MIMEIPITYIASCHAITYTHNKSCNKDQCENNDTVLYTEFKIVCIAHLVNCQPINDFNQDISSGDIHKHFQKQSS